MLAYINDVVKKEFIEFEKHHRNIYNICFHILCGFLFMTFLFSLFKGYSITLLILYSLLILFTIENSVLITIAFFFILLILVSFFQILNIPFFTKLILFFIFYFLSSLSHFLTGEKTVVNLNNLSFKTITINTLYFIPFSIQCFYEKL